MKNLLTFNEFLNESTTKIKVGDMVGNTVQGFDFVVLSVSGEHIKVKNKNTGEIKNTHVDNMYLPSSNEDYINEGATKSELEASLKVIEDKLKKWTNVRQNSMHPYDPQKKVKDYVDQLQIFKRNILEDLGKVSESAINEGKAATAARKFADYSMVDMIDNAQDAEWADHFTNICQILGEDPENVISIDSELGYDDPAAEKLFNFLDSGKLHFTKVLDTNCVQNLAQDLNAGVIRSDDYGSVAFYFTAKSKF